MLDLSGRVAKTVAVCAGPLCVGVSALISLAPIGVDPEPVVALVEFREHVADVRYRPCPVGRRGGDFFPTGRSASVCRFVSPWQAGDAIPSGHRLSNGHTAPLRT